MWTDPHSVMHSELGKFMCACACVQFSGVQFLKDCPDAKDCYHLDVVT